MITLFFLGFILLTLIIVKLITFIFRKTVKEYWEGTKILKIKKSICYNPDVKKWVIEGYVTYYNINGSVGKQLTYINDRLDGVQKYYDNKGKLLEMEIYDFGTLIHKIKQD